MSLATVLISGREWLLPAAGFVLFTILLLLWSYRTSTLRGPYLAISVLLKVLGVLALAACLVDPLWSGKRARPGANLFALLVDNSQSMQIKDRGQKISRGDLVRKTLAENNGGLESKLSENFQLRRFLFDAALKSTPDWQDMAFDGRASSLGSASRSLAERFKGQPLAGILVFSDGNSTDALPDASGPSPLPPIFPVIVGEDSPDQDIAIQNLIVTQTAFEDSPVSIQADIVSSGYAGQTVVVQVFETYPRTNSSVSLGAPSEPRGASRTARPAAADGAVSRTLASEQTQRASRDGQVMPFRFQLRPKQPGVVFYTVRVSAQSQLNQFDNPAASTEVTLANNTRLVEVDRGRGPYRILYVSGRPNWDFKYLNRAVEDDDQTQLIGLIRIAKREPKFDFRGRAGEASNPLYRGFDPKKEETERYDQPVLVRLNTRDENELRGGFPKTPEELFAYDAVIVDDLEAEFFNADQTALLQKFVSERGGGFLMLGGQESFGKGKYNRTPIGDMLPVYLDQVPDAPLAKEFKFSLTRDGWLQPWARLRSTEDDETFRIREMPPFQVFNRTRGIKPGATLIATVSDAGGNAAPALAVQRFGHGRTAALMVGDLWHWGLAREDMQQDLQKLWRQIVRWLVADVPRRIEFLTQRNPEGLNYDMVIRVRDEKFQPLDNAHVALQVHQMGSGEPGHSTNQIIRLDAQPAEDPGLYHATFVCRQPGGYYAEAVVTNASGAWVGNASAGWVSDMAEEEFRSLKPNRAVLEQLARRTGGEVISWSALSKFIDSLPKRSAPITETWTAPLWHKASVFLLALCCFAAEWGLRRWKGLA